MAQEKSLSQLESDVEQARARVAADLALLRSPETFETARSGVMDAAYGYKDQAVDAVRDRVTSASQDFLDTLKAKAAANPAAALAIAAGVGWRLYRHPPIASLLIGLGATALMRTDPEDDSLTPRRLAERAAERASVLKERAAEQVAELTRDATGAAEEKIHQWSAAAERAYENISERVTGGSSSGTAGHDGESRVEMRSPAYVAGAPEAVVLEPGDAAALHESQIVANARATRRREPARRSTALGDHTRDAYLLGFAALALGAAVGLARRHRDTEKVVYVREPAPARVIG